MTFNLVTNTIVDKTFNIIYNPVYLDFITCDSYLGLIALNIIINSIIISINFNIILSQVYSYNSYFNKLITLNTKAGNEVFLKYIKCDSNNNKLLILNLVISTIINNTFNI